VTRAILALVDQLPPPPPPRPDLPGQGSFDAAQVRPGRPPLVTVAGAILVILGVIGALGGLVLALDRGDLADAGMAGAVDLRTVSRNVGIVVVVVGAVEAWAGVLVLRLSKAGRTLGLVLASLGVIGGLTRLTDAGFILGSISLALYGVVIYALVTYRKLFRPGGGR